MLYSKMKSLVLIIIFIFCFYSLSTAQIDYSVVEIHNLYVKPIVKVLLNGKAAYFLLDTGSDIDLLHSKSAKKYNISISTRNIGSNDRLVDVNGKFNTFDYIYDLNMMIGEKHIYGNFISMDISSIVTSIRNKTDTTISGIIGSETMKNYSFIIDYERQAIMFKSGLK